VQQSLTSRGFGAGALATVAGRATSTVAYGSGGQAAASNVAGVLGAGISTVADPTVPAGHVRVYLGTDYSGVGSVQSSAPAPAPTPATAPITANGVPCIN
jgi:hypothetical protein